MPMTPMLLVVREENEWTVSRYGLPHLRRQGEKEIIVPVAATGKNYSSHANAASAFSTSKGAPMWRITLSSSVSCGCTSWVVIASG